MSIAITLAARHDDGAREDEESAAAESTEMMWSLGDSNS